MPDILPPLQPSLLDLLEPDSPQPADVVYFDLETQRSFDEVGGRHRIEELGLSVGVTYSSTASRFIAYSEGEVQALLAQLRQARLVVGFNVRAFDYRVLQPYASFQLSQVRTLDIMDHVVRQLGFRLSLDALASGTLGERKAGDGLQAIRWFREGNLDQLVAYCQKDVEIVRKLFEHGTNEGCLYYFDRSGRKQRLPVDWAEKPT